jgi:hypothetical protein
MSAWNYQTAMKNEGAIRIVPGTPIDGVRAILSDLLGEYVTLFERNEGGFCFCSGFVDRDERGFYLAHIPFLPGPDHKDIDLALSEGVGYTDGKPNGNRFDYAEIKPSSPTEALRVASEARKCIPPPVLFW